mmetsp:Transcript_17855/g.30799  ORF Transcript_17855/g.30799 Transcript_17855/m.30799 type:complete len:302 (+) Transcript_17855:79-984(+)|eukprot:CAMPEP_0196663408 /NCGR_PEP_ID=MMETSP1086-20130531/52732_1 /TAXON_ID=77921 /ORGANISM="Cyanoptyche  gloeocystis , Strain SAG4.97" /LENGTH=301 /DNA_ID=CAMNT_0041999207 /DNA_START=79 /DNA_END=984 /DNA_ORIENTATION=+
MASEVVDELQSRLCDTSLSLAQRTRALFSLKHLKTSESVGALAAALSDRSALLKHEICYCLGQTQRSEAIPILVNVLKNGNEDAMVRHEAGEALGAIGNPCALSVLREHCSDPVPEVAETCQIAVRKIEMEQDGLTKNGPSSEVFQSIDPAPPVSAMPLPELKRILLDRTASLYDRYRALFALRNRNDEEAVLAITEAFDDPSALFRHELAYVLGQMQHPASIPALTRVLTNPDESNMVRHEAAEALGSTAVEEVYPLLQQFKNDSATVVSESCVVALDMHEYYNSQQFQYADVPTPVSAT